MPRHVTGHMPTSLQNPIPTAIFIGTGLGGKRLGFKRLLPPTPSLHLRNSCLTTVASGLGHHLKRAS